MFLHLQAVVTRQSSTPSRATRSAARYFIQPATTFGACVCAGRSSQFHARATPYAQIRINTVIQSCTSPGRSRWPSPRENEVGGVGWTLPASAKREKGWMTALSRTVVDHGVVRQVSTTVNCARCPLKNWRGEAAFFCLLFFAAGKEK